MTRPGPLLSLLAAEPGRARTLESSLPRVDPSTFDFTTISNTGLPDALNSALAAAAGDFLVVLSTADELRPGALRVIADALLSDPSADVVYTDRWEGSIIQHLPQFSPERLRSQFYLRGLVAVRRSLIAESGGFRGADMRSAMYDLILRVSRLTDRFTHIPIPLIMVASPSAAIDEEQIRPSLEEHMAATGGGAVGHVSALFTDTRRLVVGTPTVSIVIPTRGDSAIVRGIERCLVVEAVRSVVATTTYENYEIIVVTDQSTPVSVLNELIAAGGARLRFVAWEGPFSFAGKMNLGIVHSRGEYVIFLNDDVEVISSDWIQSLLALGQLPQAGIVGAMLYFEDDTIQHAGHAYYPFGVTHIGLNTVGSAAGPGGAFLVEREVDGVTAACALMRRSTFFEVGGFSTLLPGNFNDVDLCMKLATRGLHSYVTPHARLYHFESKSRDTTVASYEVERAWGRWEHLLQRPKYWPEPPEVTYGNPAETR